MSTVKSFAARRGVPYHSLIGISALLLTTALMVLTYNGVISRIFSSQPKTVSALFTNTATLRNGSPVRVNGVDVGEVKSISKGPGDTTKVTMRLSNDAGTMHADARAGVVWRSLLGGTFAVKLDPGKSGDLGSASIPVKQTYTQVELDDVSSAVQGASKTGLQAIPPALKQAMSNPQTLGKLSSTLADVAPDVDKGLGAVRGQVQDQDLVNLVNETGKAVQALDAPDDQLRTMVSGAASLVQTTANRQADLRATLHNAPATLQQTNTTLADLDKTLAIANPVIDKLRKPAPDVAPAVSKLRGVATSARTVLNDAVPLFDKLRPAVRSLARTANNGLPLLQQLTPALHAFNGRILPYVNAKDPETQHSMAEMVGPALGGLGNVAAPEDDNGHYLRFPATDGSSPVYLPCQIYVANPDKPKAIECQSLQTQLNEVLSYNPLGPAPGSAPPPPTTRNAKAKR